ncbi:MAG: hypothetical protein ACFB15_10710 [Cyclobacteriaceae bacterium]
MAHQLLLTVACFLLALTTFGQDAQPEYTSTQKDWGFSITPYALLASQSTDVGGQKLRQSFNDLSSLTNSGFQVIASVRYKRLSFAFDGTFAELGDRAVSGPLRVDFTVNQNIFGFKAGYSVYENFEFGEDEILKGWALGVNLGAKYWANKVGVNYSITINDIVIDEGSFSENQEWWDPMIGVNGRFILSNRFALIVDSNIGGFGLGNASKFTYDLTYINAFKLSKLVVVNVGFRSFRYRRVDGSGEGELTTNVSVLGPMLGVSLVF